MSTFREFAKQLNLVSYQEITDGDIELRPTFNDVFATFTITISVKGGKVMGYSVRGDHSGLIKNLLDEAYKKAETSVIS